VPVDAKVVIGDAYQRIIAATRGMDGVVMSTSGRTGLSHLLIGSVAEKVVRHSPIPVITLRGNAGRKAVRRAEKSG
jgi:nucleotide-binding universal stress UspA family protein